MSKNLNHTLYLKEIMCQTTPSKIKKIKDKQAVLDDGRVVDISILDNLKVGDFVLAYANIAIHQISKKEAKEILKLLNSLHHEA